MLHESRHLYQMEKLKLKLPADRLKMEKDSELYANKNIIL